MPLIDTHAHLTGEGFTEDELSDVYARAAAAGVAAVLNIATDMESFERGKHHPNLAAAIPPHDASEDEKRLGEYVEAIERYADRLVAIGETGLDVRGSLSDQIYWFKRHIQLAKRVDLPLIIHCRERFAPLFQVLDEEAWTKPFVIHCFTGNQQDADGVIARGGYISFSGIATFKKSDELRAIAARLPKDRIVVETDAPWLAPVPLRGKRAEPSMVVHTARVLPISEEELYRNALSLFPRLTIHS